MSPFATCPTARVSCALLKFNCESGDVTHIKGKPAAERIPLGDSRRSASAAAPHLGPTVTRLKRRVQAPCGLGHAWVANESLTRSDSAAGRLARASRKCPQGLGTPYKALGLPRYALDLPLSRLRRIQAISRPIRRGKSMTPAFENTTSREQIR